MRKIRVFPAPHVELVLHVSDRMVEDYKDCICRNCENCSWNDVRIGNTALCGLADVRRQLDQEEGGSDSFGKEETQGYDLG